MHRSAAYLAARSRTPPRPTAGSLCRSPINATWAPPASARANRARALSWSSMPASSTTRSVRLSSGGAVERRATVRSGSSGPRLSIGSRARGAAWRRRASPCRPLRPPPARPCGSGHHEHPAAACLDRLAGARQLTGLAGAGGTFDDGDLLALGAVDDLRDQVVLDREHVRRAQRTDMIRSVVAVDQRHARRDRPRCQVLGEFTTYGARGDHVAGGDQLLDLAAEVGRVPSGVVRAESVEGPLGDRIAIQRADRHCGLIGPPGSGVLCRRVECVATSTS